MGAPRRIRGGVDLDLEALSVRRSPQHECSRVLPDVDQHGPAGVGRPGGFPGRRPFTVALVIVVLVAVALTVVLLGARPPGEDAGVGAFASVLPRSARSSSRQPATGMFCVDGLSKPSHGSPGTGTNRR